MRTRTTALILYVFFFSSLAIAADAPDFTIKKIGEGVYAAISGDGSKAGSNAGFIVGSNGVGVVDTFVAVDAAESLSGWILPITTPPVRFRGESHSTTNYTRGQLVVS